MRISDILLMSWKNLMVNKMRSLLTISGIAVGIGTIVFLISLGYGLQELSIKKITSISSLTALDVSASQGSQELTGDVLSDFEKIENVEDVSPLLSLAGQIKNGDKISDVVGYGVDNKYFEYQGIKISVGSNFNDMNETVISSGAAKNYAENVSSLIGSEINFIAYFSKEGSKDLDQKEFDYRIVGIIDDESSAFAYFPMRDDFIVPGTVYSSAKVKVSSTDALPAVREAIQSRGFRVTSIADTIDQVYQAFTVIQIVLALFGVIALFVALIGTFNTMTIALLERTRDIGIMKSIGVQNKTVMGVFLTESFLISFLGGTMGALFGILAGQLMNLIISALASSVGSKAETIFAIPVTIIVLIVTFSVLVGIGTGFYPAKRAGKLNPLEALRYE